MRNLAIRVFRPGPDIGGAVLWTHTEPVLTSLLRKAAANR